MKLSVDEKPHILILSQIPESLEAQLRQRFTVQRPSSGPLSAVRAIVGGGMITVDPQLLEQLPALEIVAIHGVGHENVDLDALRSRDISLALTPDVITDDVADLAIGLLLAVQRRIAVNDRHVREGTWRVPLGRRVSGSRIGIYGMGRIGQAIARRAEPFAEEVSYTSRRPRELPWRYIPNVRALAAGCDTLIVATAAGPETNGTVDAGVLELLGADGVLVNVARGSIVDEKALIAALEAGVIAGAGLDVFAREPQVPAPFKNMEQVVLAPHQGSATAEGRAAMAAVLLASLTRHFETPRAGAPHADAGDAIRPTGAVE